MKLDILYGCDSNYAPYTGVSMLSLFESNKDVEEITVYLAAMNFSAENLEKFTLLARQYNRNLIILDTAAAQKKMKTYQCKGWNGSLATWLRFFVLDQIPDDVEKLLWLDSDTIVMNGLSELAELQMGQSPVAAVCDSVCFWERFRLGITEEEPYFNAGVILFNLPYWKEHQTLNSMMVYLPQYIKHYTANDQDLLNDYFRGRILKLPQIYNVQGFQIAYSVKDYFSVYHWKESAYYTPEQVEAALRKPRIIHFFRFLGDYPWQQGNNYHPVRPLYLEWQTKSPWKDHTGAPARTDRVFEVEKFLYKVLPKRAFLHIFAWVTNRKLPRRPVEIHKREQQ